MSLNRKGCLLTKLNWERVKREERLSYVPSPRSEPATERQLRYIKVLAREKGHRVHHLPRTKRGASDVIERLLCLADAPAEIASIPEVTPLMELANELRERFPSLSPQTVSSLIHIARQVDELGMFFFFQEVMHDPEAPSRPEELVPWLLGEFVAFAVA